MKFLKLLNAKFFLLMLTFGMGAVMFYFTAVDLTNPSQTNAQISGHQVFQNIMTNEGYTVPLSTEGVSENLDSNGRYSVTFKVSVAGTNQNATIPLNADLHACKEGNGNHTANGFCNGLQGIDYRTVNLNASNNYTEFLTFSVHQTPAQACGSYQIDLERVNHHPDIAWSIIRTGMDCPNPSPSPSPVVSPSPSPVVSPSPSPVVSPSPSPVVSPSPSPVVSPSPSPSPVVSPSISPTPTPLNTVQCPVDHIAKIINSTVVCVAQNQTQTQTQNNNQQQNNNNNQDVNVTVNPEIKNTNNNNITISNPASSVQTVHVAGVSVVNQIPTSVKELPKTGLPLAAVGIASMFPIGSRLRKLGKKNTEESANSAWMKKQLGQ